MAGGPTASQPEETGKAEQLGLDAGHGQPPLSV